MERKILHIDMDCFYAAVEMRDRPSLKNVPLGIGGHPKDRSVLCTCNYPARAFGVRSAMSSLQALKLCPNLVLLPPDMEKYTKVSEEIFQIFSSYTEVVEPLSLDEAFLDLSAAKLISGDTKKIALQIKEEIMRKTKGLTASAGIAPNKLLAKIASDINKPNGIFEIKKEEIESFMKTLPVKRLFGVGKVTASILMSHNIVTCGDLQRLSLDRLSQILGKTQAKTLHDFSFGRDERELESEFIPQSVSIENTYPIDFETLTECKHKTINLLYELRPRFLNHIKHYPHSRGKNIFVKMKFSDFSSVTVEEKRGHDFFVKLQDNIIFAVSDFNALLTKAYTKKKRPVRLLGLGVKFSQANEQIELF